MNTTTTIPALPSWTSCSSPVHGGNAGSYLALCRAAREGRERGYQYDERARSERARIARDAELVLSRLAHADVRASALAEVRAESSEWRVWKIVDAAMAEDRAVRLARAAAEPVRWGVVVRWTREGEGGVVGHAARAARVMRLAGTPARAATQKLARAAIEAANELGATREARRHAAEKIARRARPLHARLVDGIGASDLPAAFGARLRDYRRALVDAFRWPSNAAQSGADCGVSLGCKGRTSQDVSRTWTKYSSRESHMATTTRLNAWVTTSVLVREALWIVDGVVTLGLRPVDTRTDGTVVYEGTFARQGRGVSVSEEHGFLAVAPSGEAVHGTTARGALASLSRRRNEAAAEREARERSAADRAAFARVWSDLAAAVGVAPKGVDGLRRGQLEALASGMERAVTLASSLAAGNCEIGTRAWVARNFPSIDPATGTVTVRAVLRAGWSGDLAERATRAALAACVRAN